MRSNFYVYAHLSTIDNTLFYIGKGTGNRLNKTEKRNDIWTNYVKLIDDKYKTIILKEGLDNETALDLESRLINKYGVINEGGILTNIVGGRLNENMLNVQINLPNNMFEPCIEKNIFKNITDNEIIDNILIFPNTYVGDKLINEFTRISDLIYQELSILELDNNKFSDLESKVDDIFEALDNFKDSVSTLSDLSEDLEFIEDGLNDLIQDS